MHIGSSQHGLVKAIQLMVAEMKGTPAVHCCLKIDQPQKNSCHTKLFPHVWPSAPDLELRGGKLSALNKLILPKESLAM